MYECTNKHKIQHIMYVRMYQNMHAYTVRSYAGTVYTHTYIYAPAL